MMTSGAAMLLVAPFSRSPHSLDGLGVHIWVVRVQEVVLMVYLEVLMVYLVAGTTMLKDAVKMNFSFIKTYK
jgi:hypothetical protein